MFGQLYSRRPRPTGYRLRRKLDCLRVQQRLPARLWLFVLLVGFLSSLATDRSFASSTLLDANASAANCLTVELLSTNVLLCDRSRHAVFQTV